MRRWTYLVGVVFTIGSLGYFVAYVVHQKEEWPSVELSIGNFALFGGLIGLQVLASIAAALAWREIVGFSGKQVLLPSRAVAIYCKTQFAKYLPGNVAQHLGRLLLAKNEGLSTPRAILSQTIEVLWYLGCAGILAVYALGHLLAEGHDEGAFLLSPWVLTGLAGAAIVGPVFALPALLELVKRMAPARISPHARLQVSVLRSLACMGAYGLWFLFLGAAMNALATNLFGLPRLELAFICSISALAWVVGFVTPGSPAGLGVRDAILLLALEPHYGSHSAGSAILAHRALTTLGDLFVFLLGILMDHYPTRKLDAFRA